MTRKNLLILNKLREEIYSKANRFLFLVRAQQIARINLSILRICLSERKERGIYISIDKPDKHVKQILERQNISREGGYVDTGLSSTGEHQAISSPMGANKRILVVSGIFCPTLFLDSIEATKAASAEARGRIEAELASMNFIMLDNISTMVIYNSHAKVHEFFKRFDDFCKGYPNLRVYMSSDKNIPPDVYQLARSVIDREVEILDEWL